MHRPPAAHRCSCADAVRPVDYVGAVLRADLDRVQDLLERSLPARPGPDGARVATGPGWVDRLRDLSRRLRPTELPKVRVAGLRPDGSFSAWTTTPLDEFLARLDAPWFPEVLNRGLLTMHFQPILDLASGETFAFEALTRAMLGGRTLGAGEVIGAARGHQAIFQFDQVARREAILQGFPGLAPGERLFINFMPQVIYDPQVCLARTWAAARQVGCNLSSLVFEVVETEDFPDLDHLRAILDAYRSRGAEVALDDVGTGKTALSYIDELSPTYIKMAGDLLPKRPSPKDLSIVAGIVDHAHHRGIKVLIEGIETEEQLLAAQTLGAELGQGFLFGRPAREMVRPPKRRAAA